jgi:hypothetical protein
MKENELLFFTPEVEATNMKRKLRIKPGGFDWHRKLDHFRYTKGLLRAPTEHSCLHTPEGMPNTGRICHRMKGAHGS